MGFSKWLMKKGAIGGATRLLIKAYNLERVKDKESPDSKIFIKIAKWRCSITGQDFKKTAKYMTEHLGSLRDFVKFLVVYERKLSSFTPDWKTGPDSPRGMSEEVIDEICNEENVD